MVTLGRAQDDPAAHVGECAEYIDDALSTGRLAVIKSSSPGRQSRPRPGQTAAKSYFYAPPAFGVNFRFCRMVRDLALVRYGSLLRVGWRDRRNRCAVGERPRVGAGMAGSGRGYLR